MSSLTKEHGHDDRIAYDKLLLTTGGAPRRLPVSGADLTGVTTLRLPPDAFYIAEHATDRDVVIVGASFIGMEVAAAIVKRAKSVTVVDQNKTPFAKALGRAVGDIIRGWHEEAGVRFVTEQRVTEFVSDDGGQNLAAVVLENGERLPAGLAVMGLGIQPNTYMVRDLQVPYRQKRFTVIYFLYIFLAVLECVGHYFANVAHLYF
jgi:NADPH-dependent 2,4-dienoyl-CoA reductase/sulfur reductase-like enzyme